jgi:diaminohydroxyphosphoribosylaminopyrimidine deaminase/5-amino-6-(5-phosphoribosylamino)uracil reductase
VLADDPALTARTATGELLAEQPAPVVIGTRAIPDVATVLHHPRPVTVARTHDLHSVLAGLFADGIRSVYVEGGPTIASALVKAGLVDEYLIYLAPSLIGGDRLALGDIGVASIDSRVLLDIRSTEALGNDLLITARPAHPREEA